MHPQIGEGVLTITHISTVARDTKKFLFSIDFSVNGTKTPFTFLAGQFVSLCLGEKLWRAYSIASPPAENILELVVRIVPGGKGTAVLDAAKVGDTYPFKGPFGHFILSPKPTPAVFIGTGTGIAPLRSMIFTELTVQNPREMSLFYGGRDDQDIAYLDEVSDLAARGIKIRLGLSRQENPADIFPQAEKCRITQFLTEKDYHPGSEFYLCGNGDMVKDVQNLLLDQEIEKSKIFSERFN